MIKQVRLQGLIVGSRLQQQQLIRGIETLGLRPVIDRDISPRGTGRWIPVTRKSGEHFGKICVEFLGGERRAGGPVGRRASPRASLLLYGWGLTSAVATPHGRRNELVPKTIFPCLRVPRPRVGKSAATRPRYLAFPRVPASSSRPLAAGPCSTWIDRCARRPAVGRGAVIQRFTNPPGNRNSIEAHSTSGTRSELQLKKRAPRHITKIRGDELMIGRRLRTQFVCALITSWAALGTAPSSCLYARAPAQRVELGRLGANGSAPADDRKSRARHSVF